MKGESKLSIYLPTDLHHRFKSFCALKGKSINAVAVSFIELLCGKEGSVVYEEFLKFPKKET